MATDPDVHPGVEPSVSAAGERLHGGHAGRYNYILNVYSIAHSPIIDVLTTCLQKHLI